MRAFTVLAVALALAMIALGERVFADSRASAYQIIVNPNNPSNGADREFLADAFLKKITMWSNGETIRPVDLAPNSPARRQFTQDVLHRTVAEVKVYWQQRIFAGRDLPPPEFDTDDDVVKYVLKYDGALGYISGNADLKGTRVLAVR
jgi:ABC-type phosphate transport system substrate-binding protein